MTCAGAAEQEKKEGGDRRRRYVSTANVCCDFLLTFCKYETKTWFENVGVNVTRHTVLYSTGSHRGFSQ